jgi:hypothetical protein
MIELFAAFALALFLAAAYALFTPVLARRAIAFAAPPLVSALLLVWYVLSEDDYRGNGISGWDANTSPGGGLATLFWVTLAVLIVSGVVLAWSSQRDRGLFAFTAIVTGIALLLLAIPTTFGFSLN